MKRWEFDDRNTL